MEKIIYDNYGIIISDKRYSVNGKNYQLNNISSSHIKKVAPPIIRNVINLIVSVFALLILSAVGYILINEGNNMIGSILFLLGGLILFLSIKRFRKAKTTYFIVIETNSGAIESYFTSNLEIANEINQSLTKAFITR